MTFTSTSRKLLLLVVIGGATSGCYELIPPPRVDTIAAPDRSGYINPDEFLVESNSYPAYAAQYRVEVPPPVFRYRTGPIETTDSWKVTHRIGDRFLIYSEDYQQRQCRYDIEQAKLIGTPGDVGQIDRHGSCHFTL